MPPESLTFDRKDLLKDRKPSSSDPEGILPSRWRDLATTSSQHDKRESYSSCRWGGGRGPSDFRRPFSGHYGKPVADGWHNTTVESGNKVNNSGGVGTTNSQILEKETSLGSSIDWKPIKWIHSGSLSSRGSGFSHQSSCKIIGLDPLDTKLDAQPGNRTCPQSPSGDVGLCVTPRTPDDAGSLKKPRLGWGEGLAKYEKKKVDPDEAVNKDGGDRNGSGSEPLLTSPSNLSDKSPSVNGYSECASPPTPYSFACSSSPGIEEKASDKAASADYNICNPGVLSLSARHTQTEGSTFNLENPELTEAAMSSLLNELLQSDETNTQASGFVRSTAMDKLQVWKAEISRKLEITETEIDSLENEFKSLVSLPTESNDMISSGDMSIQKAQDLDRQSPGTATSTSSDSFTPSCIEDTEAGSSQADVSNEYAKLNAWISASNKADAKEAFDELTNLLPSSQQYTFISNPTNDSLVKENFYTKKRFLKFKERIITLKFRAFQYLWKEDLRLLSVKRFGSKSHKKTELTSRMGFTDRSSIRSRFLSPVGNLSLVPTTEIIDYVNKLLSDSQIKIHRNVLKMPSLILDKSERVATRFISDNGLVENPCEVEKERSRANFWRSEEEETFLEKFSLFGKDFKKIASFLHNKTVADCVEFYYKNHKSDRFQKTKKQGKKLFTTNTYLVTSGKRRNNAAASLDILSAASTMAANVDDGKEKQLKFYITTSRETDAADVLAGICGSISSEALSSCITSLVDSGDRLGGFPKRQVSSQYDVEEEACSDESCGDWTDEEKSSFLQAVRLHGKDFSLISRNMKTRSRDECKVYYSKARKCLGLDAIHVETGNTNVAGGDGGSDHEDTCMVDSGSVVSCDKSSSDIKMELEVVESDQIVVNKEAKQSDKVVEDMNLSIDPVESGLFGKDPIVASHRKTLSQGDISDISISSRLSFRKSGSQRSSSTDGYHLHLPKHSLMDCVESAQLLNGYPVTVSTNTSLVFKETQKTENLLPDVGKPGDVKLFGQILTQSKVNEKGNNNGRKSFNLKFDNDGDDRNSGLMDVPLKRSYGFWDGSRIQTGFPSLPDSSILLAKYPAAFGAVKNGGNSMSGFQTRQLYSYKNQEVIQPFTVDKLLSEMPRRNHSSESLSSLGRGRSVVVGCNGVSDPVAAIRMHYAQTEQYKNGSNGDIGSR